MAERLAYLRVVRRSLAVTLAAARGSKGWLSGGDLCMQLPCAKRVREADS
jgi:hypothetical protein